MAARAAKSKPNKIKNILSHRPKIAVNYKAFAGVTLCVLCALSLVTQSATQQAVETPKEREQELYYYVGCYTAQADLLKESVYAKSPQNCLEICENLDYNYAILSADRCFCANSANEQDRQDELLCNIRCTANKAQYCGGVSTFSFYSFNKLTAKDAIPRLHVANVTEHSLIIAWNAQFTRNIYSGDSEVDVSKKPSKQITNFLIKSHVLKTYSSLPFFPQPEFIVQNTETRLEITDLHPATEYNISLAAMCGTLVCGNTALQGTTEVGQPSPAPAPPRVLERTPNTITIEIPPIRNDNGPVTKVLIIVERVDASLSQTFDTELLSTWQKAQDDGLPYYIAAELDYDDAQSKQPRKFIIGDGKRYARYMNPLLEDAKNADIHVSLGVISTLNGITKTLYTRSTHDQHTSSSAMDNFTYSTFDSGSESIIALTVTCVIFGICLILSLIAYFYLRYKTCHTRSGQRNTHEMTLQEPIIERENNGFVVEDELPTTENFKEELNILVDSLENTKRLPRNALRMNVNDVIADGRYGEVITGKLITSTLPEDANADCQLHVLALDDLNGKDQAHLLQDFRYLTRLQRHEHILDFYGVSASADWFYMVFEQQIVSLKRRLIESRRAPNTAPVQRLTALSEELVLEWIYELANALEYLSKCKVLHKQLCSHNIFITAEAKLKISVFGPIPFINNQKKVDISRWLAPEALRYHHYSTKSDVWAFACVAWECCTLGATPYANITNSQLLLDAIKSGSRPAQPAFVYQDLYQLLLNCWQLEPSERSNFEDIKFNIRQLMTSPRHALCFDRAPETAGNNVLDILPYYMPMLETFN